MEFAIDVHGNQRMNPNSLNDRLTLVKVSICPFDILAQQLKVFVSPKSRKKKQDEEEAEQKRKATETAYQGRFAGSSLKFLQEI